MKSPSRHIIFYLSVYFFLFVCMTIAPIQSCTLTRYSDKQAEQVIDAILKRLESYTSSIEKKGASNGLIDNNISEDVIFGIPVTDKNDFFMEKKIKIVDLLQVIGYDHILNFKPSHGENYNYWTSDAELNYRLLLRCISRREENILKRYMPEPDTNSFGEIYRQKIEIVTFFVNQLRVAKTIVHLTKAYISNTFDEYLNHYDISEMSKWELEDEDYEKYMGTPYKLIIEDPFSVNDGSPPADYCYLSSGSSEEGEEEVDCEASEYDESLLLNEAPKTDYTPGITGSPDGANSETLYEDEMKYTRGNNEDDEDDEDDGTDGYGYGYYGYDNDYDVDGFDEEELVDEESQYPSKPPSIKEEYEEKLVYSFGLNDLANYYNRILGIGRAYGIAAVEAFTFFFEPSNSSPYYFEPKMHYSFPANENQYMDSQNSNEEMDATTTSNTTFNTDPTSGTSFAIPFATYESPSLDQHMDDVENSDPISLSSKETSSNSGVKLSFEDNPTKTTYLKKKKCAEIVKGLEVV